MIYVIPLLTAAWVIGTIALFTHDEIKMPVALALSCLIAVAFGIFGIFVHNHAIESVAEPNAGFLQLESNDLLAGETNLQAGRPFRENYHLVNRGARPIHDAQAWGTFIVADPKINSDDHIRTVWKTGIDAGYNKFFAHNGTIGVGLQMWNTAVSQPMTQQEIDGLTSGNLRLWYLVGAVWYTEDGARQSDYWCTWLDGFGPNAEVMNRPWKICD